MFSYFDSGGTSLFCSFCNSLTCISICLSYLVWYDLHLPPTQLQSPPGLLPLLVGDPHKISFATVTGWGVDPGYDLHKLSINERQLASTQVVHLNLVHSKFLAQEPQFVPSHTIPWIWLGCFAAPRIVSRCPKK